MDRFRPRKYISVFLWPIFLPFYIAMGLIWGLYHFSIITLLVPIIAVVQDDRTYKTYFLRKLFFTAGYILALLIGIAGGPIFGLWCGFRCLFGCHLHDTADPIVKTLLGIPQSFRRSGDLLEGACRGVNPARRVKPPRKSVPPPPPTAPPAPPAQSEVDIEQGRLSEGAASDDGTAFTEVVVVSSS